MYCLCNTIVHQGVVHVSVLLINLSKLFIEKGILMVMKSKQVAGSGMRILLGCWLVIFLGVTPLLAQDSKLPQAKDILSRYFQAVGGEEKLSQLKSCQSDFKVTFRGAGVQGTMKVVLVEGGKFRQVMEMSGIGTESLGSDGKTVWATSAITGARLIEGVEAEQYQLSNGHAIPQVGYAKYFESMECSGAEKFDGVECYVVKYSKQDRKPTIDYFEKATGLLRGSRQTMVTNQGEIEVQTTMTDYRDVDGVKFPFSSVMTMGPGLALELSISSIKTNPKLDANQFDLPAEAAALKK